MCVCVCVCVCVEPIIEFSNGEEACAEEQPVANGQLILDNYDLKFLVYTKPTYKNYF